MTQPVWAATLKDDVSAVSSKMSSSLKTLDSTASALFKKSQGNFKDFEKSLRAAGVDALDAKLATEKYRGELVKTRRELLGLSSDAKRTGNALHEITRGALRSIGERALNVPKSLASGAVNAVSWIGDKVVDVGKDLVGAVLDAAQFRQNAITGLEAMYGSRKEAVEIFKQAQALAQETPLDTDKVIGGITQLATAGFKSKDTMMLFKLVADQASLYMHDQGMQDKVIAAMSRVLGRGVATGEDLESFRVAGFNESAIMNELLKKKNLAPLFKKLKKDATQEEKTHEVKRVLGTGAIGSTTFLNAVIAAHENRYNKNVGQIAGEFGQKSLTGTVSNFKSAFKDLLTSVNVDEWTGVKAFQDFLTTVTKALQGDAGKKLLGTVERIINAVLGGLARIQGSDIDDFVEHLTDLGDAAVKTIEKAWDWLDKLLHGDLSLGDSAMDVLIDVGAYIGEGVVQGMKEATLGVSRSEKKYIEKYGAGKDELQAFAVTHGFEGPGGLPKFLKKYGALREQFYAAGAAGEIDTSSKGGMDLIQKVWKFAETADVVGQRLQEQAERQKLLDTLDTGSVGTTKGGGGIGSAGFGIRSLDVPMLGSGGLVTQPTLAWIGESGPEYVVPAKTMMSGGEGAIQRFRDSEAAAAPVQGKGTGARGGGPLVQIGTISVGAVAGGDADAVGHAISNVIERELTAFLERKMMEG